MTAGKGRKGRSLARSLFPLSLSDHQPAAVAPFCFQVLFRGGKVK